MERRAIGRILLIFDLNGTLLERIHPKNLRAHNDPMQSLNLPKYDFSVRGYRIFLRPQ
jgi:hypothetical protein